MTIISCRSRQFFNVTEVRTVNLENTHKDHDTELDVASTSCSQLRPSIKRKRSESDCQDTSVVLIPENTKTVAADAKNSEEYSEYSNFGKIVTCTLEKMPRVKAFAAMTHIMRYLSDQVSELEQQ